ncbi:response regulator [Paenibacillus sp. GSMTC-2017]|uniref:response regulator n=1 Tax=Paenibacillus sp. GSMTC-2017 TaxID=2794350 RepID=UPI0018D846F9|nr:response regulator [Paenibacillus sp. GSMTC-2017]MBH5318597.1 response regulator [Paenibacillus sp. GSMTC-2017]
MISAFLVDDEEHALNLLEMFLHKTGEIQTIGRFSNGYDALLTIEVAKPDVWFLDIEMPGLNGMDLAERIRSQDPEAAIVYVTAYDQYAIKAFELAAMDYLLKPIDPDRLKGTIARLKKGFEGRIAPDSPDNSNEKFDTLSVRLLGAFYASTEQGGAYKWRTAKEKELLIYLSLQNGVPVHRDRIIEDLWSEEPYPKAKVYLHTCISLIRKHLKQVGLDRFVLFEKERYVLDANRLQVDALLFKERVSELRNSNGVSLEDAENAMKIYKGNLLQDEDYLWASQESELLVSAASERLLSIAEAYLAGEKYRQAIEAAERVSYLSPCDEPAYCILMYAYKKLGHNEHVLRTYRQLVDRLGELHLKPSTSTQELFEGMVSSDFGLKR